MAKVDVHLARTVCAYGGEEVLSFETVSDVVEFLAVSCEEEGSSSGSVANSNDISLDVRGAIGGRVEGLVVSAVSVGQV